MEYQIASWIIAGWALYGVGCVLTRLLAWLAECAE